MCSSTYAIGHWIKNVARIVTHLLALVRTSICMQKSVVLKLAYNGCVILWLFPDWGAFGARSCMVVGNKNPAPSSEAGFSLVLGWWLGSNQRQMGFQTFISPLLYIYHCWLSLRIQFSYFFWIACLCLTSQKALYRVKHGRALLIVHMVLTNTFLVSEW
jgi:hypothetical protein